MVIKIINMITIIIIVIIIIIIVNYYYYYIHYQCDAIFVGIHEYDVMDISYLSINFHSINIIISRRSMQINSIIIIYYHHYHLLLQS